MLLRSGFNRDDAYAAIRNDAFTVPPSSGRARGWGRIGATSYLNIPAKETYTRFNWEKI